MNRFASVPLGEVATLQAGVGFPIDLQGKSTGHYPLAKVGDISRVGRSGKAIISTTDHYVDDSDLVKLRAKPFPKGSILFAKIGEAMSQNHRVIAGCDMLIDNNAMAAVPGERLNNRYLYHFLRTVDFYRLASFTTVPALRKSELNKIPIPMPPLGEQRQIAEILDRAEALRAKRRAALAQLNSLANASFHDVLRREEKGIKTTSVEDAMEEIIDYRGKSPTKTESGIPLITARVIKDGELLEPNEFIAAEDYKAWMRRGLPKEGDVIFTTEAPLGEVAQLDHRRVALAQRLLVLRGKPTLFDNTFLKYVLTTREVRNQISARATGSTVRGIRQSELRKVMLPTPPISLQRDFANRIAAVQKLKASYRTSLAEMDGLFASLQDRAFKGEL